MSNNIYINETLSPVLTGDNITQIRHKHKLKNQFKEDNNDNGDYGKAGKR